MPRTPALQSLAVTAIPPGDRIRGQRLDKGAHFAVRSSHGRSPRAGAITPRPATNTLGSRCASARNRCLASRLPLFPESAEGITGVGVPVHRDGFPPRHREKTAVLPATATGGQDGASILLASAVRPACSDRLLPAGSQRHEVTTAPLVAPASCWHSQGVPRSAIDPCRLEASATRSPPPPSWRQHPAGIRRASHAARSAPAGWKPAPRNHRRPPRGASILLAFAGRPAQRDRPLPAGSQRHETTAAPSWRQHPAGIRRTSRAERSTPAGWKPAPRRCHRPTRGASILLAFAERPAQRDRPLPAGSQRHEVATAPLVAPASCWHSQGVPHSAIGSGRLEASATRSPPPPSWRQHPAGIRRSPRTLRSNPAGRMPAPGVWPFSMGQSGAVSAEWGSVSGVHESSREG